MCYVYNAYISHCLLPTKRAKHTASFSQMSTKVLFFQLLVSLVTGQDVAAITTGSSSVLTSNDVLTQESVTSLVQPTLSPKALSVSKETSINTILPSPIVINGQEGDLNGPRLRQNLFHLGSGLLAQPHHHQYHNDGHSRNDACDLELELGLEHEHEHGHEHEREWRRLQDSRSGPCHHLPPLSPGPAVLSSLHGRGHGPVVNPTNECAAPYLRVTPSVIVQPHTRTHIETSTSTEYDVSTELRTRTLTEEVYSTATHVFHPEHTFTIVNHHTYYEYPGSTIDPVNVRGPMPTVASAWNNAHPCAPCY